MPTELPAPTTRGARMAASALVLAGAGAAAQAIRAAGATLDWLRFDGRIAVAPFDLAVTGAAAAGLVAAATLIVLGVQCLRGRAGWQASAAPALLAAATASAGTAVLAGWPGAAVASVLLAVCAVVLARTPDPQPSRRGITAVVTVALLAPFAGLAAAATVADRVVDDVLATAPAVEDGVAALLEASLTGPVRYHVADHADDGTVAVAAVGRFDPATCDEQGGVLPDADLGDVDLDALVGDRDVLRWTTHAGVYYAARAGEPLAEQAVPYAAPAQAFLGLVLPLQVADGAHPWLGAGLCAQLRQLAATVGPVGAADTADGTVRTTRYAAAAADATTIATGRQVVRLLDDAGAPRLSAALTYTAGLHVAAVDAMLARYGDVELTTGPDGTLRRIAVHDSDGRVLTTMTFEPDVPLGLEAPDALPAAPPSLHDLGAWDALR